MAESEGAGMPEGQIRRGMIASTVEGSTYTIWTGALSGSFLTGMALYLGAGGFALGILGALQSLATMMQLLVAPLVSGLAHRRNCMALFAGTQRVGGALAGLLALWLLPPPASLYVFVALQVLAWVANAPTSVLWHGYMCDLVPMDVRGRYFAQRNAWTTLVSMLTVLLYGQILDRWPGRPGFTALCLAALAAALVNLYWWFQHPELPRGDSRGSHSFWESLRVPLTRPGPHLTAAGFYAAWGVAQGLATPFYPVILVQYLGLSFSTVSWLTTLSSLASILTAPLWGRWEDRVGQPRAIGVLALGLASVPLWYLLGGKLGLPPLILGHVVYGSSSMGMNLANQTLNMRLAPREDRTSYFAFFAAATGLTGFLTPVLVGPLTGSHLAQLFVCSALLSATLSLFWVLRLEARVEAQMGTLVASK